MPSPSVSFRISRHTEDLAETLHALSQRLVAMEQRLGSVEVQLAALRSTPREDAAEVERLAPIADNIERLLSDCRQLLAEPVVIDPIAAAHPHEALPVAEGASEAGATLVPFPQASPPPEGELAEPGEACAADAADPEAAAA
ncbi:MAG: hypothetical protein ACKOXO_07395 [Cyanobium sp.]